MFNFSLSHLINASWNFGRLLLVSRGTAKQAIVLSDFIVLETKDYPAEVHILTSISIQLEQAVDIMMTWDLR